MENNQPTQTPPQQTSPQPTVPPAPMETDVPHKSRFGLLFVILLVLGVVFLGGTYYMVMTQNTPSPAPIMNKEVEKQTDIHNLDQQLQSIEPQSIESDFTEVDQELENL